MLTYESTEDYVLTLSDAGQAKYEDEQRLDAVAKTHQITAAVIGGLIVGAILIEAVRLTFGG